MPLQLIQRQTDIARKVQGGQAIATPGEDAASMETMILSKSNASKRYHHTHLSPSLKQSTSIWTIDEAGNKPVQCLFINGQLRATTSEAGIAHAEALVHPALLAHPNPRRIAVISDMPLPFLKEILKHKSIKEVTLVGVDPNAIELAEYHMKELNDCYMDGKYNKCMDDERITVVNENVHSWLNATVDIAHMEDGGGQYDVILVLDASSHMNSQLEGEEEDFVDKLQYLMGSSDSLVVFNAGSTPRPDDDFRIPSSRDRFLENILLEDHGFGTAALYDEPRSAPLDSTFVILFSSINDSYSYFSESYFRYVRSPPTAIDLDIMDRFHKQEFVPARNYDGATHANYLVPSRAWENWYCESELGRNQTACKNFMKDFYNPVIHQGEAEVRRDPVKGRGLYAVNDIPKGAYINADDSHMNLHIHRYQMEALQSFVEEYPDADMYNQLLQFFHAYGFENEPNGQSGWTVSVANVNTFINHACSEEARNAEGILDVHIEDSLFSPILYRQKNLGVITIAARDIKAGEELQMDYSGFRSTMTPEYANLLKSFCETGEGLVDVNGEDEL